MHGGTHFRMPWPATGLRARVLVLSLLLSFLLYPIRSATGSTSGPDYLATVIVDPSATGQRIPNGFLGISHEWDQARILMGDPEIGTNAIYRQLLSNLVRAGAGHLVIRIGGRATDQLNATAQADTRPFASLFRDFSTPEPQISFILGINLAARDISLAAGQARGYLTTLPAGSVTALEIGHEPDTYPLRRYRPEGYLFPDFLADFRYIAEGIRKAVPAAPAFTGPSLSPSVEAIPARFAPVTALHEFARLSGVSALNLHAYCAAGTACGGIAKPGMLLAPAAIRGPETAAALLETAARSKKTVRITEMNALLCPEPGISNSFESALWLTDILFEYARAGVSGINLHTNNWNTRRGWDTSSAFLFHIPEAQYKSAGIPAPPDAGSAADYSLKAVHPLYYGVLLFAEGAPSGSALLPAEVKTEANVRAWATRNDATGELKVVLINKEPDLLGKVSLSVPGYRSGKIKRLMAPSYRSQSGITFAGQTFDGSTDGTPAGKSETEAVSAPGSAFEVPIGPASAVLITFQK